MSNSFLSPQDLYLASADRITTVLKKAEQLQLYFKDPNIESYHSVIGGLSGLNHLLFLKPKKIIFFDINEAAIPYCEFIIELIKNCNSHKDFIESFFLRRIQGELNHDNQKAYLREPINKQNLNLTLSKLSEKAQNVYKQSALPLVKGETPSTAANCMEVLPCWNPRHGVPVGVGKATAEYEGGRVPNVNTFFYGQGWLQNEESYNKIKERLISSRTEVVAANLCEYEIIPKNGEEFVLHISNIDNWFPKETAETLAKIKKSCLLKANSFGIALTTKEIYIMTKTPHAYAYDSIKKYVSMPLTEVTHIKPWGFGEFERTNITVDDFLTQNSTSKQECCILHILAGEGIPRDKVKEALKKSIKEFSSVIVMEHNSDSLDWPTNNGFFSKEELELEVEQAIASSEKKTSIKKFEFVRGKKCQQRNMLFYISEK